MSETRSPPKAAPFTRRMASLHRRRVRLFTADTLFLAARIAFMGRLVQYAGRILRPHPGKTTAEVHDYYDVRTGVLASSLAKRAPGYTALGFPDPRRMSH